MDRMGRTNGHNEMTSAELMKKLQALAFAKVECELYLDAYPECAAALQHYKEVVAEYAALANMYEEEYGPIRQENVNGERWTWVDMPWPWQSGMNGEVK